MTDTNHSCGCCGKAAETASEASPDGWKLATVQAQRDEAKPEGPENLIEGQMHLCPDCQRRLEIFA